MEDLRPPARPRDLHGLRLLPRAEAEAQSQVVLRTEAAAASHLVDHPPALRLNRDARPDGAAVGPGSFELDQERVVWTGPSVVKKCGRVVHVVDDGVHLPGVEEVAEGGAAGGLLQRDPRPRAERDVPESPVAPVHVKDLSLPVGRVERGAIDLRVDVAIDDQNIRPAVAVEVEEMRAPAEVARVDAEPRGEGAVAESAVAPVVIQRAGA